jgi:hypothetical protein
MFIFFGNLPRIHKSHAADPNGSADPRLGTPGLYRYAFFVVEVLVAKEAVVGVKRG